MTLSLIINLRFLIRLANLIIFGLIVELPVNLATGFVIIVL